MRDLAVKDNALIVATHGRGFWVLDDITPLRQVTGDVSKTDAFLFDPEAAYILPPPSENGTPQPRDEPLTDNQPYGAIIDFYLGKGYSGLVKFELLNAAGDVLKTYSSDEKPKPVDPDTLDIPAFWIKTPPVLPTTPGMHRWLWDLRPAPPPPPPGAPAGGGGGRRQMPPVLPGNYTIRLTAGDRTYTRPLVVKPDPRAK